MAMSLDPVSTLQTARALYESKQAPEAIQLVQQLLAERPGDPNYLINLSLYLRAVGNFEGSVQALEQVPENMPGYAMLKGWHELRAGNFLSGSRYREKESGLYRIDSRFPFNLDKRLTRETSVVGKKVLLALEGGNGDEVAYARFAHVLKNHGAMVMIACSLQMHSIMSRSFPDFEVCDISVASHDAYDYYVPALSIIDIFELNSPTLDINFPYLIPSQEHVDKWSERFSSNSDKLKIGIQWQGNLQFEHVEFKTIPASLMASLAEVGDLYSLQRPENVGENKLPISTRIIDTQIDAPNWEDTLACISLMDVVIAGDTTITHIAGALGKKACVLLPHAPHPYWADLNDIATWYPSVHVFRQPLYNDWSGAVDAAMVWLQHND